jgi:hypothetical protein
MKETMNKPIVKVLLGIFLTPTGSLSGYFYIRNIGETTPILMLLAIIMVPSGIYFLSKSMAPTLATVMGIDTAEKLTAAEAAAEKARLAQTLDKNNEMLQTWNKTNKTRDDLKLLQLSEGAGTEEK